jgi:LPXTG-site transpeptidase (sortase) family protein
MNKSDKDNLILVALVLIVCTISLVAVGVSLWRLIGPGVSEFANVLGLSIKISNLNYNFNVPVAQIVEVTSSETSLSVESSSTSSTPTVPALNYNFNIPEPVVQVASSTSTYGFEDAILSDAELAGYGSGEVTYTELRIKIPKISVDSPIVQGLGGEGLKQGFWVYPSSNQIGNGEMILLCHRRYFGPNDPRSCWYIDQVSEGDEIFVSKGDNTLKYSVVGTHSYSGSDSTIYTISDDNYIKIVTCHPLGSSTERFVVLAKLVN